MSSKIVQLDMFPETESSKELEQTLPEFQKMVIKSLRALFAQNTALKKKQDLLDEKMESKYEEAAEVLFGMNNRLSNLSKASF